ncbi:hypothetical protein C0991_005538, partial [Blastosporella zonata]
MPPIPPVKIEETKKCFADMDHKLETVLATLQKGATQYTSNNTSGASQVIGDQITALQQEIQALQKKQDIFDGVEIPRAKPFSKNPLPRSGPSVTFEKEPGIIPTPNRSRMPKTPTINPASMPPIRPYASANPRYQSMVDQNPMDHQNDPSTYRNKALIADLHKSKDIFDKFNINNAKIAMTAQSEIESKIESKIETKTSDHFGDTFETDYFLHLGQLTINNPYELYHQSLTNDHISEDVQVAKEADVIRTLKANLNNFGEVDCIVDSGSQVVAISEAMA